MVEPVRRSEEHYTYTDIQSWPEGERWELIDGVAYDMTPAPGYKHQETLGELFAQFHTFLQEKPCQVIVGPYDVFLSEDEEPDDTDTIVEPDLLIVCDQSKISERGLRGAPDLIIEILSPSSVRLDTKEKFHRYERAGVREYWIVRPEERTVMVFRLNENRQYGRPGVYFDTDQVPVVMLDGLTVDLGRVFSRKA